VPATSHDPALVDRFLKRRRRWRRSALVVGLLLATSVLAGNAWQRHVGGDDATRFDRRTFRVDDVVDGDTVRVVEPGGRLTPVRLAGVAAPESPGPRSAANPATIPTTAHWSAESRRALAERVTGREVLLRLPPLAQRSVDGVVRAYLYLPGGPADSVNELTVAAGDAYADRRTDHPYRKAFEQAESEARRRRRGLWKDVRDDEQPDWRRAWLQGLKAARGR
jgi:micrococcal nuclease